MKKTLKRFGSFLLAMALALGMMAGTALAAGNGSITIKNTVKDKSYDLYKILDLTYSSGDKVSYTIDSDWTAFFAAGGVGASYIVNENTGNLNAIVVDNTTKYINITDSNVSDFAEAALSYAANITVDKTVTGTGGDVAASGLDLGYYLVYPRGAADITEGNASICSLTSTTPDAEVNIKADYPKITKTVDDSNPEIGQKVTYTITGQVPDTTGYDTYTYTVKDTMSSGLTFNKDVKVTIDGTEVNVTPDYETTSNGFSVDINVKDYQEQVGKDIVVTYTATVNANAVVGSQGNANKAELIYSNDPNDSTSKTTNPPVEVKVYTAKLVVNKVDGEDTNTKLAGAKFVLKNKDGDFYKYDNNSNTVSWVKDQDDATEVTTDNEGDASFNGLENGTYKLVETEAPAGYNKLTEEVTVSINYANDTSNAGLTTEVKNFSGTTLPSTGGMGTTIFYIVGGILVVGAGVLLITKKRMDAAK